ncbi:MAG TPA: hypothetical protein ENN03_09595 [bacterium]|nr:hypothetical protein [bacterium]
MRCLILITSLALSGFIYAQSSENSTGKPDSIRVQKSPVQKEETLKKAELFRSSAVQDTVEGELVLETIEIKGRVEKPGVIIMPSRLEANLKKVELDRSFEKELKEGVGEIVEPKKELRQVEKVKSIKKTVGRERK